MLKKIGRALKKLTIKKVIKGVGKVAGAVVSAIPVVGTVVGAVQGAFAAGKQQAETVEQQAVPTYEAAVAAGQTAGFGSAALAPQAQGVASFLSGNQGMLVMAALGALLLVLIVRR